MSIKDKDIWLTKSALHKLAWPEITQWRTERAVQTCAYHMMCLHSFVFKFRCSAVATPSFSLSSGFVSGFDLWNRAGAFQVGLEESPHLCLLIFCQRKLQMNRNHMFLFYLRPSHGKKMAFQLREELAHGCNSKCLCLSLRISKAIRRLCKKLWRLV